MGALLVAFPKGKSGNLKNCRCLLPPRSGEDVALWALKGSRPLGQRMFLPALVWLVIRVRAVMRLIRLYWV